MEAKYMEEKSGNVGTEDLQTRLAALQETNRIQVDRILNPKNVTTLASLQPAAAEAGRRVTRSSGGEWRTYR
jgi:hypothetical protein